MAQLYLTFTNKQVYLGITVHTSEGDVFLLYFLLDN